MADAMVKTCCPCGLRLSRATRTVRAPAADGTRAVQA
jgi:hypothetical protein